MDVEVKEPPLANGTDGEDDLKSKVEESTEKSSTELIKPRQKHKRSRSRTPSKTDDCRTLQINLTKIQEDQNGTNEEVNEKETNEKDTGAHGETDNNKQEDEPITKRTRHQKELATQENNTNVDDKEEKEKIPRKAVSPKKVRSTEKETSKTEEPSKKDGSKVDGESESMEMEPLVLSDEHEPELQFDELSDKESGKGSPVIPRCLTRRSLTRNIPTPKTPKSVEPEVEPEQASTTVEQTEAEELPKNDADDTNESTDSTKAEVGSDETRLEYVDKNVTLPIDDTYLDKYREKSLTETIRGLSARRPIRDSYRNRTFRIGGKSDLDGPFHDRSSFEVTSSGIKRKDRSVTPEETKKFRSDTSSIFSSPLASLRGKFKSESVASSTPLLRGYRDSKTDLHFDENQGHSVENGMDDKKNWCSLM